MKLLSLLIFFITITLISPQNSLQFTTNLPEKQSNDIIEILTCLYEDDYIRDIIKDITYVINTQDFTRLITIGIKIFTTGKEALFRCLSA